MYKIVFTRPSDGGVSVVVPNSKENIEEYLGYPVTDQWYRDHIYERSIPEDALNVREIQEADHPKDRVHRNAWVDVTKESRIDICCERARDNKLADLRRARDESLTKTDGAFTHALEMDDKEALAKLKAQRQALRDSTNKIKALDVKGKYNDEELLQQIVDHSDLSKLV